MPIKITQPTTHNAIQQYATNLTLDTPLVKVTGQFVQLNTSLTASNLSGVQIGRANKTPIQIAWNEIAQALYAGPAENTSRLATVSASALGVVQWNGTTLQSASSYINTLDQGVGKYSQPVFSSVATPRLVVGSTTYVLPSDGINNQALVTDGSGNLRWSELKNLVMVPIYVVGDYQLLVGDNFVVCKFTRAGSVTLPSNARCGGHTILIENASDFPISIHSSDTIEGDTQPYILGSKYDSTSLVSDGIGNWIII